MRKQWKRRITIMAVSLLLALAGLITASPSGAVYARNSVYTQHGAGPKYWSTYEYQQSHNTYMDENEFKNNIDWLYNSGLAAAGYNMVVTDGWGRAYTRVTPNGYLTTHDDSWTQTYSYWVNYLAAKGMYLGVYANPLWMTHAVVTDPDSRNKYKVIGTNIPVLDLLVTVQDGFNCVDVTKSGAEQYIKGYVQHFINLGVKYLRIDFLRNYENTMGSANYATALRWMKEAAGDQIELSLVMPNLYDHGKNELQYGDLVRIDDDALLQGWTHISGYERGNWQSYWSQFGNAFDGFVGFSDIAGKSGSGNNKLILDGDFLRFNAYANDAERKFALSIFAMAGSPLSFVDQYNSMGSSSLTLLKNQNLIALNNDGFVGRPLVIDILNAKSQIWKGRLSTGEWVVGLFNRENSNRARSINFARDLGLSSNGTVTDMWSGANLGAMSSYTVDLPAHDVRLLKITGTTTTSSYIQAEYGTMLGNAHVYVDKDGAYNTNGVGYIGETGDGVQFDNVAGGSTLTLRYANGSAAAGSLDLYINGGYNQTISFPTTGGWTGNGVYQLKTVNAAIPDGATVKLVATGVSNVNLDYIASGSGGPSVLTTAEAEDGELLGYLTDIYYDASASKSMGVGYIDSVGDGVQWRNMAAGSQLTIHYATAVNAQLSLYVNGVKQVVSLPSTGSWTGTYADKVVNVTIPQGATVKLQYDSGDSTANIDKITVGGADGGNTWENLGGTLNDSPAISSQGLNQLDAFIRGSSGLEQKTWNGTSWSGWSSLGGPTGGTFLGKPAAVSWGSGRIDVFVRGTDNAIYHRWYTGGAWSSVWENLGGSAADSPGVSSQASGKLDVFYRGTDNQLYQKTWTGTGWTAWTALGGPNSGTFAGAPAAVSWSSGRIDVFVEGTDHVVYHLWYTGGAWSTVWENLGGYSSDSPAAASKGSNQLEVFIRGGDNQLWKKTWTGTDWIDWTAVGGPNSGTFAGAPAAVSAPGSGQDEIVVLGTDNAMYHLTE